MNDPKAISSAEFSPKAFLKTRRPERFSDTVIEEHRALDRSLLEYHLDTLTSRNQDVPFAIFARHLAEREICPNLLPQTGPTGGGDSKVDSETYPVADSIALGWYTGIGREAASERWGFAFSAKKKWQNKFLSDVAKAVETGRGYAKVFFVTNQFIRDKARAQFEDDLSKKYGIDVRILDRTWILDTVFAKRHELLAIDDLQIDVLIRRELQQGPLDIQRARDFEKIEKRIQEALAAGDFSPHLADDCIEAADLARQMERPQTEIYGLYDRAELMAERCGGGHQQLQVAYQKAWTVYWWFEDYQHFNTLYEAVERRAKGSANAYDLELLSNCWSLLHSAILHGKLEEKASEYPARTEVLLAELEQIARDDERPSTAFQAKSLQLNVRLLLAVRLEQDVETVLREFKQLIESCEGLVGFPFEPVVKILTEVGESIGNSPAYDDLFNTLVTVQTNRQQDVAAAQMLVKRGEQQLKAGTPYDAIRSLGRSLGKLYKHETRRDAVYALYLCGQAYEDVGLLWAARGTFLSAASLATRELSDYGEITKAQAACYRRLKWIELRLGRVSQAIEWHHVDALIRGILIDAGKLKADLKAEIAFDIYLGSLLLDVDFSELPRLSSLPDVLDSLGLFNASIALKYALGHSDELRGTLFGENESDDQILDFFVNWRGRADEIGPVPLRLYDGRRVNLESTLLGCKISIDSENSSPCVKLSESILAAVESLLSTGTVEKMAAIEPYLTIKVGSSSVTQLFEFELRDETGRPHLDVRCDGFNPHVMTQAAQKEYRDNLLRLLGTILARVVITDDWQETYTKLFRDELALERSVNFTGSFVTVATVLGYQPKVKISDWSSSEKKLYTLMRTKPWGVNRREAKAEETSAPPPVWGKGEPPKELRNPSHVKHSEISVSSLIRSSLWEKAGWSGTVFAAAADDTSPPILGLGFKNIETAKLIFHFWIEELGIEDPEDKLRVAIIRGIDQNEPYSYRVHIGTNVNALLRKQGMQYGTFASRINRMSGTAETYWQMFLQNFKKAHSYFLMPALFASPGTAPTLIYDKYLLKRELHVRQAWEIGRHDPDSVAIQKDDKPIIPPNETNAPILELLRHKAG